MGLEVTYAVLDCTHYPFAAAYLRTLVGPDVQLLDNGGAVALQTRRQLEKAGTLLASTSMTVKDDIRMFSNGQTDLLQAAAQYWLELEVSSGSLYIQEVGLSAKPAPG